ncbi:MAG: deoxyribose-phosphate aldolase [Flavobacteriaceae bacterium]|nr:deoxyribose-phosphate aldolase [Flavobacteriaceae bacterium]|tara:strand:- start:42 stop:818 length:777 start_codon:yes stop_codon:yes gene_type:complete
MKKLALLFLFITIASCNNSKTETDGASGPEVNLTAQTIIDKTIENACNGNCDRAEVSFTFRDKVYKSKRLQGFFTLERITNDSTGIIRDELTNEGFTRSVNDIILKLADTTLAKLSNSVNSVHYFAQLPYGLNAPAVQKQLVGTDSIKGKPYYEVKVTFKKEGGGTDYEDEFMYWIHQKDYTVDYLAYSYEVDGGGIRFREAYNPRVVEGIRFVDYNNYKVDDLKTPLSELDDLFEVHKLPLLSKIETENVEVKLLNQ